MGVLLTCDNFNLSIQGKSYSSAGFEIKEGEVLHLFATSDFDAQTFLLLMSGLYDATSHTEPGTNDNLERREVKIPRENLSFLRFDEKNMYPCGESNKDELAQLIKDRAKKIGFIYENPDTAIFGRTVKDDFFQTLAITNQKLNSDRLSQYDLFDKMDRETSVLSGGEKHRLICANAFERKPKLIIGDFSSSNLDRVFLRSFIKWISDYVTKYNGAAFLHGLSHEELNNFDLPVKKMYADKERIIMMEPPADLFPTLVLAQEQLKNKLLLRNIGEVLYEFTDVHLEGDGFSTKPISFVLHKNEIIVIEGENGCGKTTLGKIITGRCKKYKGEIQPELRKGIGIALQFPERSFIFWKIKNEFADENLLNLCGISQEQWELHPRSLSRAQQKLLSIAVALYHSKDITVLDEPTSGMDFSHKLLFVELLNKFNDRAIIIFNHDPMLENIATTIKYS